MKQRIISFLTAALIFGSVPAWAEEIPVPQNTVMTADEAVDYALSHSLSLAAAKAGVSSAQYSRNTAYKTYRNFTKSKYELDASTFEAGLSYTGYYVDAADTQLAIAERNLKIQENSLKTDVRNAFYSYLNTKNKTELAKTALESAREKENFAKARQESGVISALDYQSFQLSVLNSQNALNQAIRNEEDSLRSLKDLLNFPEDQTLSASGSFTAEAPAYLAPEEAVPLSRTQNTYKNLSDAQTLAKNRWDRAQGYYFPNQSEYSVEKANFEQSDAEFQSNVRGLVTGIHSAYNGLLTLKENIEYLERSVELLSTNTQAMYLRYEMGMVTANDYLDAEQKLFETKNSLLDLKLTYYTSIQKYNALYQDSEVVR